MSQPALKKIGQVRPDSKGRIALGKLAKGVSSFMILEKTDGTLLLEPMMEIPAREKWLFENQTALRSVRRGLEQSSHDEIVERGSFAKFADEEDEKD